MLLSTEKPLLYYETIFRSMLISCGQFLQQYAAKLDKVYGSLRKLSNSMRLHFNLGLFGLILIINDNFNKNDILAMKVAISYIHNWFLTIESKIKEQLDIEKRPLFGHEIVGKNHGFSASEYVLKPPEV